MATPKQLYYEKRGKILVKNLQSRHFEAYYCADKEEALPLIRRFYNLGFNIEATVGKANFLKQNGIRTRVKKKISDGSEEILDSIRKGYVTYVISTRDVNSIGQVSDGYQMRRAAVENNVTMFTALDTVRVLLDVLEETTLCISTIDA